jgi:hypothetical protein
MTYTSSSPASKADNLTIAVREGEDAELISAKVLTGPFVSNAFTLTRYGKPVTGEVKLDHVVTAMVEAAKKVKANDMSQVEELLISQAMTLNMMFGELSRRAAANMGEYMEAHKTYMMLALKAQNQARMTLETLSTIKNPPIIYAKQANIANGPQQVNNGTTAPSRANENQNPPNKLLEAAHEQPLDPTAPRTASGGDKAMATVEEIDGTTNA